MACSRSPAEAGAEYPGQRTCAQLCYNTAQARLPGPALDPAALRRLGPNTPVNFTVTLPSRAGARPHRRARRQDHNACLAAQINASVENMRNPKTSAHLKRPPCAGRSEERRQSPLAAERANVPSMVDLDANATIADNSDPGQRSARWASATPISKPRARSRTRPATARSQFKSRLALGELGRLAKVTAPGWHRSLNGNAKLDANNNYMFDGNIAGEGAFFPAGRGTDSRRQSVLRAACRSAHSI